MAQENITITLPVSRELVVLRPFISHKVARKLSELAIGDKEINTEAKTIDGEVKIKGKDIFAFNDALVHGLVIQLGDRYAINEDLAPALDELDEEDFALITEAAAKIYADYQEKVSGKKSQAGSPATPAN